MDLKRIRGESIVAAKRLGVDVPATLPLLDAHLEMRGANEVISRILAMNAVAAVAYGFDKKSAVAWLRRESLIDSLSEGERQFLNTGTGRPDRFQAQIEGMWALAWAMGIVNQMNFSKYCDNSFVNMRPNLKRGQSSHDLFTRASPRPLEQVAGACDLAYCLDWAIRQSELDGKPLPPHLKPYVVIERRRALEWLLSHEAWDDISLDT